MNAGKILLLTALSGFFEMSSFAQTWTQTSAPTNLWTSVASSATGAKLAAVGKNIGIYTSTNSGITWQLTSAPSNYWNSIDSSADGTTLVAGCNGPLYVSTNSGLTWLKSDAPSNYWGSIAGSADGVKWVALAAAGFNGVGGPSFWTSTNSGLNWMQRTNFVPAPSLPNPDWISVASSADGTKLIAVGLWIYYSLDSGATWTATASRLPNTGYVGSPQLIACSADGNRWVLGLMYTEPFGPDVPCPIYTTTNFGMTWTQTAAPSNHWTSVVCSADGNRLVAVGYRSTVDVPAPVYSSTNFGQTWISNSLPAENFWTAALSADGGKVVVSGGLDLACHVFTAYAPVSPRLTATAAGSNEVLSWYLSSTNFVVQRLSDLRSTNWTSLTNTAVANFSSLQNQVTLPSPGSNSFYRLKTP